MENRKVDLETLKYLVEHLSGILPENFSHRYLFSEALALVNTNSFNSLYQLRVKLIETLIKDNKDFFERLRDDINSIADACKILLERKIKPTLALDILWEEIGLDKKEKERFLLYIKGFPFMVCKEKIVEDLVSIRKFVDMLSDREKLIIGLYYYEGLTLKEISKSLHIDYKELVLKFSIIAFKFLFRVCEGICINEKNKV